MRRRLLVFLGVAASALVLLSQAQAGLKLVRVVHSLTGTHYWYQQTVAGHQVLGGYYARHYNTVGGLVAVTDGRRNVRGLGALGSLAPLRAVRSPAATGSRSILSVLPGRRARPVWAITSPEGLRTIVDARTGAVLGRESLVKEASGQGRVFDPSPVVTLANESLTDQGDADYAALQAAYFLRTLTHLDGSGYLRGDFADIRGSTSRAKEPSLRFLYGRSDNRFEQTMAYYDVTGAQSYIQSLGFTDVNNEPQVVKVDQLGVDNSFFNPVPGYIKLGKGGVDDGEDAEVTWHEYGHAIQDAQVPGFGSNHDAGSIGEGFGDYWAFTMSEPVSGGFDPACIADWDSTSYTSTVPHCLRRVDTNMTVSQQRGEVHFDGRLWSRALYDIHQSLGRGVTDQIILEAQFSYAPDTSFAAAARTTVATAQALHGTHAANVARRAFQARGIVL